MKKIIRLLIISCAFVLIVTAGAFSVGANFVAGDEAELTLSSPVSAEYDYNYAFSTPSAVISRGNDEKSALSYLVYPDGTVSYATNNLLGMVGRYQLVYYADFDGKTFSCRRNFTVNDNLFTLSGNGSYTYHDSYEALGGISGLEVNLQAGDVFTFNQLIDVKSMDRYTAICQVVNLPSKVEYKEYSNFFMILTDSVDPSNQVIVRYGEPQIHFYDPEQMAWGRYGMWVVAGTTMDNAGCQSRSTTGVSQTWGEWIEASMYGFVREGYTLADHSMDFYLDYENKIVFGNELNSSTEGKIIDLDDPNEFEDVWQGFESGKARLSFYATGLNVTSVKVFVETVADIDLSKTSVQDDGVGPQIELADKANQSGIVGMKYYFGDATAYDVVDGKESSVKKAVYRNYYSSGKVNVDADTEGFVPDKEGIYTVEYSAKDMFGNLSVLLVDVNVASETDDMEISAQLHGEYIVGKYFTVPDAQVTNACGSVKTEASVLYDGQKLSSTQTEGQYLFTKTGTYTVVYRAEDALKRTAERSYDINVVDNNAIEVYDSVEDLLPENFLVGFRYELPELKGYCFSNNGVTEKIAKIRVESGKIEQDLFFTPESTGSATIEYYFEETPDTAAFTYSCPVYNVLDGEGNLSVKEYFAGSTLSVDYNAKDYIELTANTDGSAQFVNALNTYGFEMRFKVNGTNFQTVSVILSDKDTELALNLYISGQGLYFNLNGTGNVKLFDLSASSEIIFTYDNLTHSVSVNGTTRTVRYDKAGGAFEGFATGKAMLTVAVSGVDASVTEKASIELTSLNKQVIKNLEYDSLAPEIVFVSDAGGLYDIGDTATTPECFVSDVLSPTTENLKISVNKVDTGEYITALNGVRLEKADYDIYNIRFEEYGTYLVTFSVKDAFGNAKDLTFNFYVLDTEEPQAALTGDYATSGKVGKTVTLATCNATDNSTASDKITIKKFVVDPNGKWTYLADGTDSITLTEAGVYKVYYRVIDETGNNVMLQYSIIAEGK